MPDAPDLTDALRLLFKNAEAEGLGEYYRYRKEDLRRVRQAFEEHEREEIAEKLTKDEG